MMNAGQVCQITRARMAIPTPLDGQPFRTIYLWRPASSRGEGLASPRVIFTYPQGTVLHIRSVARGCARVLLAISLRVSGEVGNGYGEDDEKREEATKRVLCAHGPCFSRWMRIPADVCSSLLLSPHFSPSFHVNRSIVARLEISDAWYAVSIVRRKRQHSLRRCNTVCDAHFGERRCERRARR